MLSHLSNEASCIDTFGCCSRGVEEEEYNSIVNAILNLFSSANDRIERLNILHDLCRDAFYELDDGEETSQEDDRMNDRPSLLEIRSLIENHNRTPKHYTRFLKAANYRGLNNWTPLHWLLRASPPTDLVEQLILAAPATVLMKNNQGSLPLHIACSSVDTSVELKSYLITTLLEIIRLLVDAYPEAIDVVDNIGDTPVSILRKSGAAAAIDEDGNLLLHHACLDDSFPLQGLRLIVEGFPGGMYVANNQGKTPPQILSAKASQRDAHGMLLLHHQANSPSLSLNLLRLLFHAFPSSVASTDKRGMLPFHHACMNGRRLQPDILLMLIHLYPESVQLKVG